MRIRQVVIVAKELEPVAADVGAVFGTEVAFNDPSVKVFGLKNAVLPLGDQFVEIVSPVEEWATAKRYLERRKGDGGYMLILQSRDLDADERRLETLGVRIVWKGDLPDIRGRHLHPKDTGGTLLSLDQAEPPEEWPWAGPRWKAVRQTGGAKRIVAAELQAEDPARLAHRWGDILGRAAARRNGSYAIEVDGGSLRFSPASDGRGEGLGGFDVEVAERERVLEEARRRGLDVAGSAIAIGGARFRLV